MRLFKISGKVESCNIWSNRKADYVGYFIQEDGTDDIIGYVKEQSTIQYDPIRYIKGVYAEDKKQLMFMKLCNVITLRPLAYVFSDLDEKGQWSVWNWTRGFFPDGDSKGQATVQLKEVLDKSEKKRLVQEVYDIFNENASRATNLNRQLMEEVADLKGFVDKNSPFYLKQHH